MKALGVAAVVVLLVGLSYLLWGFWLGLIVLTIVYIGLSVGVIFMTAKYYDKHNPEKAPHFEGYLWNNNAWFFALLGATIITFVIACFHFGPALLLPEKFPTPEQRGALSYFFDHLLHGYHAGPKVIPTEPLPWARGTWFWWKAWGLYSLLTFGFFWFAFYDEAIGAIKYVKKRLHEAHEEALARKREAHRLEHERVTNHNRNRRKGESALPLPQPPPQKLAFADFLKWDLIVELSIEAAKAIFFKK